MTQARPGFSQSLLEKYLVITSHHFTASFLHIFALIFINSTTVGYM